MDPARRGFLAVKFVKILSHLIASESEVRELVPFQDLHGYHGLFVTGNAAQMCFAPDHGPVRFWDLFDKQVVGIANTPTRLIYQFHQVRFTHFALPSMSMLKY